VPVAVSAIVAPAEGFVVVVIVAVFAVVAPVEGFVVATLAAIFVVVAPAAVSGLTKSDYLLLYSFIA
jgi:hypothetical protein